VEIIFKEMKYRVNGLQSGQFGHWNKFALNAKLILQWRTIQAKQCIDNVCTVFNLNNVLWYSIWRIQRPIYCSDSGSWSTLILHLLSTVWIQ
jgi:hypothetical protein